VLPWLAAHAHDRFFVYVHAMDTHTPYAGGSDAYDDEVRANDLGLRRLYDGLAALGVADTTLLVVTADHGESFGEHGVTGHGSSVYQEEASVPLVFAHGSLTPGRVDLPAHHVDVLPTILGRCGVRLDGRSFEGVDLLAEPRPGPARTLFVTRFAYPLDDLFEPTVDREWHAVVRGDWKLIVRHPRDPHEPPSQALYDLAKDPRETADLSAHRSREVEELSGALRDFHARERVRRAEFLARYPGPVTMGLAGSTPPIPASLVESLKSLGYIR
jgi:arylsulfatase A-like enzyme